MQFSQILLTAVLASTGLAIPGVQVSNKLGRQVIAPPCPALACGPAVSLSPHVTKGSPFLFPQLQ